MKKKEKKQQNSMREWTKFLRNDTHSHIAKRNKNRSRHLNKTQRSARYTRTLAHTDLKKLRHIFPFEMGLTQRQHTQISRK